VNLSEILKYILPSFVGLLVGYYGHALRLKVDFKQRTIENKIKVYDAIITHWVKMRNFIYAKIPNADPHVDPAFDALYGESQAFIGEAILVSEDVKLAEDINALNEKFYRTNWVTLPQETADNIMESIKSEGIQVINRMRSDVKIGTKLCK